MTINSQISQSQYTVAHIVEHFDDLRFFVDDSFQRRLVWVDKQKVKLIETIMMGYPIPEIYLHQQPVDPETMKQTHSIVDGQQRMNCLLQFTKGEWPLHKRYLDKHNRDATWADKDWKSLSVEAKSNFLKYVFHARVIDSDVQKSDIVKVFRRINETDRSLNPQEIRHAEFAGEFIGSAEKLANLGFWKKYNVFNINNIRRMVDVEFTTALLIYLRAGVSSDTSNNINKMYDLFNEHYPQKNEDFDHVVKRLKKISDIFDASPRSMKMFSTPVHLYTLFTSMDVIGASRPTDWYARSLELFVLDYEAEVPSGLVSKYKRGAEQRTRSKSSRDLRGDALFEFMQKLQ